MNAIRQPTDLVWSLSNCGGCRGAELRMGIHVRRSRSMVRFSFTSIPCSSRLGLAMCLASLPFCVLLHRPLHAATAAGPHSTYPRPSLWWLRGRCRAVAVNPELNTITPEQSREQRRAGSAQAWLFRRGYLRKHLTDPLFSGEQNMGWAGQPLTHMSQLRPLPYRSTLLLSLGMAWHQRRRRDDAGARTCRSFLRTRCR
jgi:hypothetical protein